MKRWLCIFWANVSGEGWEYKKCQCLISIFRRHTSPPHTLEFLLVFHFVIFSEKSPFVDIETVFGKIHIFSIHFTIHSSFLDLGKCLCFPLSLWRDSKNLSFLRCLRPHWIFACSPHWTLRGHLHLDIGLNVNFRALSALVVVVYVYWNTPNRQKKKR